MNPAILAAGGPMLLRAKDAIDLAYAALVGLNNEPPTSAQEVLNAATDAVVKIACVTNAVAAASSLPPLADTLISSAPKLIPA